MTQALKTVDLLNKVKDHVRKGTYVVSAHALERQNERHVSLEDVLYVLKTGVREESKELFDVRRQLWKYAIRGFTVEKMQLRVIVSFVEEMVIITVMRVK